MPHVPGLRSPYAKVGRLVYFGRMLDKVRLHAAGKLPPDYHANLGETQPFFFDARCCRFLGVPYVELRQRVLEGATDEQALAWAETRGRRPGDEDCVMWNRFVMKLGWRDERSAVLKNRLREYGIANTPIETMFDLIEYDEGRDPVAGRDWAALG